MDEGSSGEIKISSWCTCILGILYTILPTWEANALTIGCPQLYIYLSAGWSSGGLGFGQVLETEYFLDPLFSTNHPNQNTVYSAISTKSIILQTIQHSHLKGLQTKIGKPYRCDLSSGNEVGRCNRPSLGERVEIVLGTILT